VAKTTAKVEDVSLLDGAVTAEAVTAVAKETIDNGSRTRSTEGSGFVGLKVLGILLPVNVAPNTVIPLPLFEKVILNQQKVPPADSTKGTEVNGIVIVITKANALNLPIGAKIIVAHARARALLFEDEPVEGGLDGLNVAENAN